MERIAESGLKVVILAAGNGHRLVTPQMGIPKPLYPVGGTPLLDLVLDSFVSVGLRRFVLVLGFMADRIRTHCQSSRWRDVEVDFVFNSHFEADNALSVLAARPEVTGHFILGMADHLVAPTMIRRLVEGGPEPDGITLAVDPEPERVFDLAEATKVRLAGDRVLEVEKALTEYEAVDTGLFYAGPALHDALEDCRRAGRTRLSDGVNVLASRGKVRAVNVGGARWVDVDTPRALAEVERWLNSAPSRVPDL